MIFELTKKMRFESAHRLGKGYEGKCRNIHGHSWNGEIKVSVTERDQYDFGVDFSELKRFVSKIEDLLDHKILLWNEDEELLNLCDKHGWKYVVFNANPTCEIIAEFIYGLAKDHFAKNLGETVKVVGVRIEETCTTSCTYTN